MSWKQMGIIAGALVALFTLVSYASPIIGDPIPLAGIARVDGVQTKLQSAIQGEANATKALVVQGQIEGMWARCRDALKARDLATAQDRAVQLARLQASYILLTGDFYPLQTCP